MIKKQTCMLTEQTKTKPQETLEFKMNKQMQTFSFNPPTDLSEEGKWLIAVTSSEATNSDFTITDENNSSSFTTPVHGNSKSAQKTIDELTELLELRCQIDFELHVEQVRKKAIFY